MTASKKPKPPARELSAFKDLLKKLMRVPKSEINEKEAEYQRERALLKKKRA